MKKLFNLVCFILLASFSSIRVFAATPVPTPYAPISDPAASNCPGEDQPAINIVPGVGRGSYPFPSERPTLYSQPTNTATGTLSMNQSCSEVRTNLNTCVNSNTLRFNYQGSPCPNGYNSDSDGCYLDIPVSSSTTPSLVPGTYFVHDLASCWKPQIIDVGQGCAITGSLACQDGSGQSLRTTCGGSSSKITIPTPPPPANKDGFLQNGVPVAGKTCAKEISTPISLQKDFCVSGGSNDTLQLMPKNVNVPFAQDTGQYLSGILDWEHLTKIELDKIYDRVIGLPGITLINGVRIGFPGSRGISPAWDFTGPINRLTPQLEQDRLKHEFLGWLCEPNGDTSQGRWPKNLNTRYYKGDINPLAPKAWTLEAPILGSQIIASLIPNAIDKFVQLCSGFPLPPGFIVPIKDYCQNLANFVKAYTIIDPDPVKINQCELYDGSAVWPDPPFGNIIRKITPFVPPAVPVKDVYVEKLKTQCKKPDGSPVANCPKTAMYKPNFIEQAVWDRVPLFANEEGKGEVEFQVCNSNQTVKVPFAVPQLMRLASASAYLQQLLLSSADNQKNKQAMNFAPGPTPPDNTCVNCQDAQNGPPDTQAFIDYYKTYGDSNRGTVAYNGGGTSAKSDQDTITVRNNVPFLLSIWYQTAGGPFGIFNIFRGYRSGDKIVTGLFQPAGKPFAGDGNFLDTPGSSLVQYSGANIKTDVWKLLYSKIAGVWNAKNWIMQSVAPY